MTLVSLLPLCNDVYIFLTLAAGCVRAYLSCSTCVACVGAGFRFSGPRLFPSNAELLSRSPRGKRRLIQLLDPGLKPRTSKLPKLASLRLHVQASPRTPDLCLERPHPESENDSRRPQDLDPSRCHSTEDSFVMQPESRVQYHDRRLSI